MKVFIITEGGRHAGFGHVTRCISLYEAFEEKGVIPEFIVNGDESIEELLRGKNYRIFNWLKEKNKLFELIKNADIAIIDSYLADISFYKNLCNLAKIPVYIDGNKRLNYPKGVVVNGNIYAEELDYPQKDGIIYLLGTKYVPLRKEFWEVPKKEIKEKVESVMVTFGGDDARNMTPRVLKFLVEKYPKLIKNVVIGKGFRNIEEIKKGVRKKTNLIYYPGEKEIKKVMIESDIAISGGGQTLYELIRVGLATAAIIVADNQIHKVDELQKLGLIRNVGFWDDKNLYESLISNFPSLLDKSIREVNTSYIDGKGSERIINNLTYLAQKWTALLWLESN